MSFMRRWSSLGVVVVGCGVFCSFVIEGSVGWWMVGVWRVVRVIGRGVS